MADVTVSVRIEKELHNQMKLHEEINWSAIMRKSIVEQLEKQARIDVDRAQKAAQVMGLLRQAKVFGRGKSSVEVIREWRQKRR